MRQLCNLLYIHLRPSHHPDCLQQCGRQCPRAQFHEWLEGPALARDHQMHERFLWRREALLRGEIPA